MTARLAFLAAVVGLGITGPAPFPSAAPGEPATPRNAVPRAADVELRELDLSLRPALASIVRVLGVHEVGEADPNGQFRKPRASVSSGVAIDREGHVLTTANALAGCREIRVRTMDGRDLGADLVGLDPLMDLALVRIPAGAVEPLPFAPPGAAEEGAPVVTLGHSYGAVPTRDVGRITWRYREPTRSLIQMTNAVYPGNSGGAAIDLSGRLVGLIIGALGRVRAPESVSREVSARGSSFAIPVDELAALVEDLKRYGGVRRAYLGVHIEQGRVDDPARPDEPFEVGVRVSSVVPGGPAWNAGLRAHDLVVAVRGRPVNSPDELMRSVTSLPPGSAAEIVWVRDEERRTGTVHLGTTPDSLLLAALRDAPSASQARIAEIEAELERLEPGAIPSAQPR